MEEPTPAQYQQERNASYDRILAHVQARIDALTPPITENLVQISPGDTRETAARDVWKLFQAGIRHLKDGGQMNQPGAFSEAVSKASLRNSSLATTLGVKPPKFEENYLNVEFDSGAAEAYWRSRRLMEAVAADAPKSQQLIRQKLGFTTPLAAPDKQDVSDPELKGVFDAARKSAAAAPGGQDPLLANIRRQAVLSFNFLCDQYAPLAETLKNDIADLLLSPPPKPMMKGQSFDL